MKTACWLAIIDFRPDDVVAPAVVDGGGEHLVVWRSEQPPVPWAAKVDPRAVDPDGGPGRASLFDDVAVSQALINPPVGSS